MQWYIFREFSTFHRRKKNGMFCHQNRIAIFLIIAFFPLKIKGFHRFLSSTAVVINKTSFINFINKYKRNSVHSLTKMSHISNEKDINPLLSNWYKSQPYGIPPFSVIQPHHFKPAILFAMKLHLEELHGIVNPPEPQSATEPTFYNVIEPLDRAGGLFESITNIFYNLCSSHTNPNLQQVELELSTIIANHQNKIYTFPKLFEKIEIIYNHRFQSHNDHNLLNPEQIRLIERFYLDFIRQGKLKKYQS